MSNEQENQTIMLMKSETAVPVTYDTEQSITLTLDNWLAIKICLYDAATEQRRRGHHYTAKSTMALRAELSAMLRDNLDAAAAHNTEQSNRAREHYDERNKVSEDRSGTGGTPSTPGDEASGEG